MTRRHRLITQAQGIHGVVSIEFANASEREAFPLGAADVGKVIKDVDSGYLWLLLDWSPNRFAPLTAPVLSIPFNAAIRLGAVVPYQMEEYTISAPLALTLAAEVPLNGGECRGRFIADGVNAPTVPSTWLEDGGSMGFDNRVGIVNRLFVEADAYDVWFAWKQAANPVAKAGANVLRFGSLFSAVESGNLSTGYNYGNAGTGSALAKGPSKSLAANANGSFSFRNDGQTPASMNTILMGWSTTAGGPTSFNDLAYALYGEQQGGGGTGKYKCYTSGLISPPGGLNGNANVAQAPSDYMRSQRVGTNALAFEVSKDGGATWITIHTFAGVTAQLWPALTWTGPSTANVLRQSGLT